MNLLLPIATAITLLAGSANDPSKFSHRLRDIPPDLLNSYAIIGAWRLGKQSEKEKDMRSACSAYGDAYVLMAQEGRNTSYIRADWERACSKIP